MGTMTKKMEEIAMKKRIVLLSLLAALCCLFTVSAAAADAPTSGTCGANLTWTLDGEGTLRIAGEGAMRSMNGEAMCHGIRAEIVSRLW